MTIVAPDRLPVPDAPPTFVATGDVFERAVPLLVDDQGLAGSVVRSPVPLLLNDATRSGTGALLGNWVADVTVARCRLPARQASALAAEIDPSVVEAGLVRVGRTGTAAVAVAHTDLPQGLLVDHALTGLSLRDPDLAELLSRLLPDGTTWQLSDAGRFYQGLTDMAGGLSALVDLLREPAAAAVLDGYLDITSGSPGLLSTKRSVVDACRAFDSTQSTRGPRRPTLPKTSQVPLLDFTAGTFRAQLC